MPTRAQDPARQVIDMGETRKKQSAQPFRVWQPDPEGHEWVLAEGWRSYPSLAAGADALLEGDRREVQSDDAYHVTWDEEDGYLAVAQSSDDPPEPLEILSEEEDLYEEGDLDQRPTLLGAEGPGLLDDDDDDDDDHGDGEEGVDVEVDDYDDDDDADD